MRATPCGRRSSIVIGHYDRPPLLTVLLSVQSAQKVIFAHRPNFNTRLVLPARENHEVADAVMDLQMPSPLDAIFTLCDAPQVVENDTAASILFRKYLPAGLDLQ